MMSEGSEDDGGSDEGGVRSWTNEEEHWPLHYTGVAA